MGSPSVSVDAETFKKQTAARGVKVRKIWTTPPTLGALEVGEVMLGNGAQGAGLITIYFKANKTQLVVLNVNTSTNAVTASVIT